MRFRSLFDLAKRIMGSLSRQGRQSGAMPYPSRTERASIVVAAITVLDERGLDRVSLRAIATCLCILQPALYHHFGSKAKLRVAVANEILSQRHTHCLPADDERWAALVAQSARSMRRTMLRIRDGARLIASSGSRSPHLDTAVAQVSLLETGLHGRGGHPCPHCGCALHDRLRDRTQTARDGGDIVIETDRTAGEGRRPIDL
jgi:TetR/AcrR family tetracycline transcriptional repressor